MYNRIFLSQHFFYIKNLIFKSGFCKMTFIFYSVNFFNIQLTVSIKKLIKKFILIKKSPPKIFKKELKLLNKIAVITT